MSSPPLPKLLDLREVADLLCVSRPMAFKLTRTGALPCVRIGTSVRVHPADLAAFVEERRGKKAAG